MLVLVEIGVLMLMVDLPNLLIHFTSYLSSWLLSCYLFGLFVRIHFISSCLCKSWHNGCV
jgi:hypothetical protein